MKKINEATYTKEVNLQDVYYLVRWSHYIKYDKYDILKRIPEMPGLFLLLYNEKHTKLKPFYLGNSWMGSLRHDIKFFKDEPEKIDSRITQILEDEKCFYKYVIIQSHADLEDIYSYYKYRYRNIMFVDKNINKDSGRYTNVFVKEFTIK